MTYLFCWFKLEVFERRNIFIDVALKPADLNLNDAVRSLVDTSLSNPGWFEQPFIDDGFLLEENESEFQGRDYE